MTDRAGSTGPGSQRLPVLRNNRLCADPGQRWSARLAPDRLEGLAPRVEQALGHLTVEAHLEYAHAHAKRFEQTLSLLKSPAADDATLLELSAFPVVTEIATSAGYWCAATVCNGGDAAATPANIFDAQFGRQVELNVEIETQRLPTDDELFDVVLALEIIEHLPRDPMQLLVEANRSLRHGGQLIISTPNIVGERGMQLASHGSHPANYYFFERSGSLDRHHFEWTPELLGTALRAAGFFVDELETHFSWWDSDPAFAAKLDRLGHPRHLRGDNIIASATKVTPLIRRTPDELYVGENAGPEWELSQLAQPRVG